MVPRTSAALEISAAAIRPTADPESWCRRRWRALARGRPLLLRQRGDRLDAPVDAGEPGRNRQLGAKLAQDGGVKAGVGKLQAQRVLPVDPAADRVGKLVLDSREAVVDGVLDGGRQANRRTTGHQADGKHQILRT